MRQHAPIIKACLLLCLLAGCASTSEIQEARQEQLRRDRTPDQAGSIGSDTVGYGVVAGQR